MLHQTGKLCTPKDTINKIKRQTTKLEKIFANPLSDNKLIFKIYKGHLQLKNKRQIAQFFKWTKDMNKHFFNLVVLMANKYMKRCLASLIIKEMQSKTTNEIPLMSYYQKWKK